jgi:hypothetical protein
VKARAGAPCPACQQLAVDWSVARATTP